MVRKLVISICLAILLPVIAFGLDLQALIDQKAAEGGGIVYLEPGVISVNKTIILRKGVSLQGAYPASHPDSLNSHHTILCAVKSDIAIIETEEGWSGRISDLVIDGQWIAKFGIILHNALGASLENILIMQTDELYGTGLYLVSDGNGRCGRNYFHRVNVFYGRIGIWLQSLNGFPVTLNVFNYCHVTGNYISIRFTDHTDSNYFSYCRIGAITYGVAFEDDPDVYNNIFLFPVIEAIEPDAWGIVCKPSDTVHTAPNKFIEPYFGYFFPSRWENYLMGEGNCKIISLE